MLNIDEILADIQTRCNAGRPPCGDTEYICVSRKDYAQLAAEYKRMAEVVKAAESLLGLCINCGDFRNGNTAYGIDEGEVGAGKIIAKLEQALAGLEG